MEEVHCQIRWVYETSKNMFDERRFNAPSLAGYSIDSQDSWDPKNAA